jgi:hypothetical protein
VPSDSAVHSAEIVSPQKASPAVKSRFYARPATGLKYTYGQSKITMLEENDLLDALAGSGSAFSVPQPRRLDFEVGTVLAKTGMQEDLGSTNEKAKARIQDIHELRQAGANSRAADEMHDLLSQMGNASPKPSTTRRAALLQVASRMTDKDFRRLIRDHGVEASIFQGGAKEGDVVAGLLIAAIILQALAFSPSALIIEVLQDQEIGCLFGRLLLPNNKDVKQISRDRSSNVSKRSQSTVAAIEAAILGMPIWTSGKLPYLTPRTLALKCLETIISRSVDTGKDQSIFPPDVTDALFEVLGQAGVPDFWVDASAAAVQEVQIALSVLEFHVMKAVESHTDGNLWIAQYLPTVANVFEAALHRPQGLIESNDLEDSVLKVVLNIANFSTSASEFFVRNDVLTILSTTVCQSFAKALELVSADGASEGFVNGLILKLCVLINFAEESMHVRQALHACRGVNGSVIQDLVQLFLQNHRRTAEVYKPTLFNSESPSLTVRA